MSAELEVLQPEGWPRPAGYANGIAAIAAMAAQGRLLFVAGQIGWNPQTCLFESDDFVAQTAQALRNVAAVLGAAGAEPRHITRLTWFITDKAAYLAAQREIGIAYREVMGRHYPAMSVVVVAGLIEDRAKVEIEATAILLGNDA